MTNDILRHVTLIGSGQTEAYAEAMGKRLQGGEVIELSSDLGGGKTTFVRGLARGAGSADHVSSPTFTVSKIYAAGSLQIHHFDFYRLTEPGIIQGELEELLGESRNVIVIEWSGIVESTLPEERLTITFTVDSETSRRIKLHCPASMAYVLEGLE